MISEAYGQFRQYRPLIHELVSRDLKVKYRRSFLGYLWSLLNPLLMMVVMSFVFSTFFDMNVDNYPLYLICGNTLYSFFTESTNMAMNSVLESSTLIRKIYVPKFIFPVSRVLSSFVTMSFSLVAILIVMVFTGSQFYWTMMLVIVPVFFLFLFCCGLGMSLSSLSVYFRDIKHLWGVVTLAWMYATPIFYTIESLPNEIGIIIMQNPLNYFLSMFRSLVMSGIIPDAGIWIGCVIHGLLSFALGLLIFGKLQKNFILHI